MSPNFPKYVLAKVEKTASVSTVGHFNSSSNATRAIQWLVALNRHQQQVYIYFFFTCMGKGHTPAGLTWHCLFHELYTVE